MLIFKWGFTIVSIMSMLVTISQIDRPRKPITRGEAMLFCIAGALWVYGMWMWT